MSKSAGLNRARNAQLANLTQDVLNPRVEIAAGVLVAGGSVEVLLDLGHAAVGFCAEAQLDLDKGFECGVEVGYSGGLTLSAQITLRPGLVRSGDMNTSGQSIVAVRSSTARLADRTQPWPVPNCQPAFA